MATEDELAKHVAAKCLNFKIYFDTKQKICMELGGQKWVFSDKTDAEAIDRVSQIFSSINIYMWEIINEKVLNWVSNNKQSFN